MWKWLALMICLVGCSAKPEWTITIARDESWEIVYTIHSEGDTLWWAERDDKLRWIKRDWDRTFEVWFEMWKCGNEAGAARQQIIMDMLWDWKNERLRELGREEEIACER